MTDAQHPQHWPDRRVGILAATVPICIISSLVLIWRVVYGIKTKRKLMLCDYLLVIAAVSTPCQVLQRYKHQALTGSLDDERFHYWTPVQDSEAWSGKTFWCECCTTPLVRLLTASSQSNHQQTLRYKYVQLLFVAWSSHQFIRSGSAEVLHLCVSSCLEIFEGIHVNRLGFYRPGCCVLFYRACIIAVQLHAV